MKGLANHGLIAAERRVDDVGEDEHLRDPEVISDSIFDVQQAGNTVMKKNGQLVQSSSMRLRERVALAPLVLCNFSASDPQVELGK